MRASKRKSATDWSKASRYRNTKQDYDELPELTDEQLDRAEIAIGGTVIRAATGTLTRPRGRPKVESPKETVSFRADAAIAERVKDDPALKRRAIAAFERVVKRSA